jgi:hypothetical protein
MTKSAHDLLTAFDALPAGDQAEVAAAILRKAGAIDDLPEEGLIEPADDLFSRYDSEETADAQCQPR